MNTKLPQKQLTELLKNICPIEPTWDRTITGLASDSRAVKPGDLFFAYPGLRNDGRQFINMAIERGAAAIVTHANEATPKVALYSSKTDHTIPIITVSHVAAHVGAIAACFYNYPSRQVSVIGVTGTAGKTSCSQFIAAGLQMENKICGIIGSLGYGLYGQLQASDLNTQDAIAAQKILADMVQQQAQYVAMEVSSHGLIQQRVQGIEFDIGVFTNLSQDHLDYHGNMENYANAKRLFFSYPGMRYAVLNADDPYGRQWCEELENQLTVYTYSLKPHKLSRERHIAVHQSTCDDGGITASIHTPWGDGVFHNPYLVGQFNLSNLLAVLTTLNILAIPLQTALAYLAQLRGVQGRMETFGGGTLPLVIVDHAHKPGALEQVLTTLRQQCRGKLWCVLGCGGNRDKSKRPIMGEIAEKYADRVIITDDNPRDEDRREIAAQILTGLAHPQQAIVEHDRRRAIAHAIACAVAGDIVLIAGKGHESYQIVGNEKIPLSDSVEVQMRLAEKNDE